MAVKARHLRGMVIGMATTKVTITLDEEQLARIRGLVSAGKAASISGFVQHAVSVALDDVAGWGAMLAEALEKTGGDLTAEERAWADEVLGTGRRRKRPAA
jgi:Arc/MetJ-type ribon-helix-helix transcriptional regulator